MSGRLSALSADYSQDELDAVADAFGVPARGSAALRSDPRDPLLRAGLAAALRGLVARRAIAASGTAASPRIELLEPHGTLLGAFVGAERIVSAALSQHGRRERSVAFIHGGIVVKQQAVGATAISRMTARASDDLAELLLDPLLDTAGVTAVAPAPAGRRALEAAADSLNRSSAELRAAGASSALIDLVHARRRTLEIVDVRIAGHRVEQQTTRWLDAGDVGWWRIDPDEHDPPATVTLSPCSARDLTAAVTQEGPSPT